MELYDILDPNDMRLKPALEAELIHAIEDIHGVYLGDLVDTRYGDAIIGFEYDPKFKEEGEKLAMKEKEKKATVEYNPEGFHAVDDPRIRATMFATAIGRNLRTLYRWDAEGILKAHRTETGRLYYLHEDLVKIRELEKQGVINAIRPRQSNSTDEQPKTRVAIFVRAEPVFYKRDNRVFYEQKRICLDYAKAMGWDVVLQSGDVRPYTEMILSTSRFCRFCEDIAGLDVDHILVANPWVIPIHADGMMSLIKKYTNVTVEYVMYGTAGCPGLTYTKKQLMKLNPASPFLDYAEDDDVFVDHVKDTLATERSILPIRGIKAIRASDRK